MQNFIYSNRTQIVFGQGTHCEIGKYLKKYTNRVLFHYGGGSIKRTGVYDRIIASLNENQIEYEELGGVCPNPRLSLVRRGIQLCREKNLTFILAVGGGSVLDSAKAIALGAVYDGDVWDFYTGKAVPEKSLQTAGVLTIPAAGSESSISSVITDEESGRKMACNDEVLRPVFSIIDPSLFLTLPKNQMANGVCDMMSHIMERYFTNTKDTEVIDAMSEGALRAIMNNARKLNRNLKDQEAWTEIALAGNLAHNGIFGLGREEDWGCHDMEHELSARYDIPHGAGLAVLTPVWMRWACMRHLPIFVQFAVNVMGVSGSLREEEAVAMEGIRRLEAFFCEIGLPVNLKQMGIDGSHLEEMAKKATGYCENGEKPLGNMEKLYWKDILSIYQAALEK